jgi:hypothetical protein
MDKREIRLENNECNYRDCSQKKRTGLIWKIGAQAMVGGESIDVKKLEPFDGYENSRV